MIDSFWTGTACGLLVQLGICVLYKLLAPRADISNQRIMEIADSDEVNVDLGWGRKFRPLIFARAVIKASREEGVG